MNDSGLFVALGIPGMETGQAVNSNGAQTGPTEATPYKIPPVIWMLVFLIGGYMGVRMLLED